MTRTVAPSGAFNIPPAALEAGKRAALEADTNIHDQLIAAFEAMVEAWPGMYRADWNDKNELDPVIILPLTQEASDD